MVPAAAASLAIFLALSELAVATKAKLARTPLSTRFLPKQWLSCVANAINALDQCNT